MKNEKTMHIVMKIDISSACSLKNDSRPD